MSRIHIAMASAAFILLPGCTSTSAVNVQQAAYCTVKLTDAFGMSGGSGFPIACERLPDGRFEVTILTAAHVVAGGIGGWDAIIASERWVGDIELVGTHPVLDAALVRCVTDMPILCLDLRERPVSVAERVWAIGYPMVGRRTITEGRVGDLNACSTPIYPGNSGGPLVDVYGNCVGIIVSVGVDYRGNHYQLISHDAVFVPVVECLDWLKPHL
jgi:S1-C subfamily serine protease